MRAIVDGCAEESLARSAYVGSAMTERPVLEPTAAHPITVEPTGSHVTVRVNGDLVAETDAALTLQESTYPAVQYIPLADVVVRAEPQRHHDLLPVQGRRQLLPRPTAGGDTVDDAIWTYEQPYPAVAPSQVTSRSTRTRPTSQSPSLWRCPARLSVGLRRARQPGVTLSPLRRGSGDPCYHDAADGAIWRTSLMPSGPVTARIATSAPTPSTARRGATAPRNSPSAARAAGCRRRRGRFRAR